MIQVSIERFAQFREESIEPRCKLEAAMAYPILEVTLAVLIVVGLLVQAVPKFKQVFADLPNSARYRRSWRR